LSYRKSCCEKVKTVIKERELKMIIAEYFLYLAIFFLPLTNLTIYKNFNFSDLFFLLSAASFLFSWLNLKSKEFKIKKICFSNILHLSLIIVFFSFVSLFNHHNPVHGFMVILQFIFSLFIVVPVTLYFGYYKKKTTNLLTCYILGYLFLTLFGFGAMIFLGYETAVTGMGRIHFLARSPNEYGVVSVFVFIFSLVLFSARHDNMIRGRMVSFLGFLVSPIGIVISGSRTAFLSFVLVVSLLTILLLLKFKRLFKVAFFLLIVAILTSGIFFRMKNRSAVFSKATIAFSKKIGTFFNFMKSFDLEQFDLSRYEQIKTAYSEVIEKGGYLIGEGIDNKKGPIRSELNMRPHDFIFMSWLEIGLIGTVFHILFYLILFLYMLRYFRRYFNINSLCSFCIVIVVIISDLTITNFLQKRYAYFFLSVSLLLSLYLNEESGRLPEESERFS